MTDNHHSDSVYHGPEHAGSDRPQPPLRAFFIDTYDEDTDEPRHAYYGVERPEGEAVARTVHGNGLHLLGDVRAFADRIGGAIVWV